MDGYWLQRPDSNRRPRGYEPRGLPDCPTLPYAPSGASLLPTGTKGVCVLSDDGAPRGSRTRPPSLEGWYAADYISGACPAPKGGQQKRERIKPGTIASVVSLQYHYTNFT